MNYLKRLKACSSQKELASFLGHSEKSFTHILFSVDINKKYNEFRIAKKSGGIRKILSPAPDLKVIQTRLAFVLTSCYEELERKRLDKCTSSQLNCISSHGFRRKFEIALPISKSNPMLLESEVNLGIYTNAKRHTNKKYVLNVDIENFFESITFSRIVGFFTKNKDFSLEYDIAVLLAQIVTYRPLKSIEGYLPQGSPCSPIISNFIGDILDFKMLALARKYKCTYTRYADDLTFSTNIAVLPIELAYFDNGKWIASNKLVSVVESCKFKINHKKTRVCGRDARQEVTSLTVNSKVNINRQYYRYTRSMINEYCSKGKLTKTTKHAKRHFWLNDVCTCHGLLPSHSA